MVWSGVTGVLKAWVLRVWSWRFNWDGLGGCRYDFKGYVIAIFLVKGENGISITWMVKNIISQTLDCGVPIATSERSLIDELNP
jgi:hypothetical protein